MSAPTAKRHCKGRIGIGRHANKAERLSVGWIHVTAYYYCCIYRRLNQAQGIYVRMHHTHLVYSSRCEACTIRKYVQMVPDTRTLVLLCCAVKGLYCCTTAVSTVHAGMPLSGTTDDISVLLYRRQRRLANKKLQL